jgi:DNA-binding response OmpR family regulator
MDIQRERTQSDSRLRVCIVAPPDHPVDPVVGALAAEDVEMTTAPSIAAAAAVAADAYVLDLDGFARGGSGRRVPTVDPALVAELRAVTPAAIVALSRRDDPQLRVGCFDAGADDYLCHAWSLGDLASRVRLRARAVAGAVDRPASAVTAVPPVTMTPEGHALLVRGREVPVTPRERELIALLISHPGRLFTRDDLLTSVWGDAWTSEGIVTEYVRRLRRSLKPHGADGCLVTRHRYGYLWDPQRMTGDTDT